MSDEQDIKILEQLIQSLEGYDTPGEERAMGDPPPKKDKLTLGSCCDDFCEECILDISCHVESNCPDDCGGPHGNPIKNTCDGHGCIVDGVQDCHGCGCIPPWTEAKKRDCWSCGPNQLKKSYWEEAQCACPGIACPDGSMENCCSDGEACCELANYDWEQTFCNGGVSCEEQKRLSRLAMRCWWRKYTRNGACQCGTCTDGRTNCECQGTDWMGKDCCSDPNCISHGGSMTCSELLRMHNGGPCSWDDSWTEDYIVKGCTWACANSPGCASCLDCNCDPPTTVEKEKKEIIDVPDRSTGESSFPGGVILPSHNPDHAGIYKFTITNKFPYRGGHPSPDPKATEMNNTCGTDFPNGWAQLGLRNTDTLRGNIEAYIPKNMGEITLQGREGFPTPYPMWGDPHDGTLTNRCEDRYQNGGCVRPYFNWYEHMRVNRLSGYIVIKPKKHNHEIFHEIADKVVRSPAERYKDDNRQVWAIYRFNGNFIDKLPPGNSDTSSYRFHKLEFVAGYRDGNVMFEPTAWCRGHAIDADADALDWIEGDCGCVNAIPGECNSRCRPRGDDDDDDCKCCCNSDGVNPCVDYHLFDGPPHDCDIPATATACDDPEGRPHTCCERGMQQFFTIQVIPDGPTNMDPQPAYCFPQTNWQCEKCMPLGHGCFNGGEPLGVQVCVDEMPLAWFDAFSAGFCGEDGIAGAPTLPCPPEGPPPFPEPGFCCWTAASDANGWSTAMCDTDVCGFGTGRLNIPPTGDSTNSELMQQIETMTSNFAEHSHILGVFNNSGESKNV